jgi:hypothetical protein
MPDTGQYENGFNLVDKMIIHNYRLDVINISHVQVKRWNEYSYPTYLLFNWIGTTPPTKENMNKFFDSFINQISGIKIIRSDSNRPYKCLFMWPSNQDLKCYYSSDTGKEYQSISFECNGYAKRIGETEARQITDGIEVEF